MHTIPHRTLTALALLLTLLLSLLPGCGETPVPGQPDSGALSSEKTSLPGEAPSSDAGSSDAISSDIQWPDAEEVLNPAGEETYGPVETDNILKYRLVNDKFYEVVDIAEPKGRLTVPSVFAGKPVMRVAGSEYGTSRPDVSGGLGGFYQLIRSITFSEGMVDIGVRAMANEESLQKVTLPASLRRLGEDAFATCTSMTAVEVAEGSKYFRAVDGVLFTLDEKGELDALRYYPAARPGEEYTVPEGVKTIDKDWLCGYHLLRMRRLILPSTITSLAAGTLRTDPMSIHRPGMENQTYASPFDEIYIPSGVEGLQENCITTDSEAPLKICCEDPEKPASWDDNWCSENCIVEWGVKR